MAGKISDAEKNLKVGSKFNSNMVKISSSKSILSYQNGSALNIENREETADEGMLNTEYPEEMFMAQEPFSEDQNLKSDCLDLLRKKLISDLSLTVFSPDLENKLVKMEPVEISKERQTVIQKLLVQISQLSDAEKLLLYLKLPCSTSSPFDPLRQPLNPLGNRQEIQQTIVWIKTHLEEDSEISIPKQDVYDQYLKYCENVSMKPLSTADFGKVMKQVYPGVRPRRLGTRGNSRYCYSGMRNTCKLPTPILPQSSTGSPVSNGASNDGTPLSAETNKFKKVDRTKRKLKTAACRNEKCSTFGRACAESEKEGNCSARNIKRSKVEEKKNVKANLKEDENPKEDLQKSQVEAEQIKKEVDLSGIKCEESSNNSFNAFDIECGLDSDFGIYFKNLEKGEGDPSTRSSGLGCDSPLRAESEEKQNKIPKTLFNNSDPSQILTLEQNEKNCSEGNVFAMSNNRPNEKTVTSNCHVTGKMNGLDGLKSSVPEQRKAVKGRLRRSTSLSKPSKNLRKCYVPIQPKPVDLHKLNVRFEQPLGINQFPSEQKRDLEGPPLCEESDSQEPEEEIVRYFKHLDNSELNPSNAVDEAVKNISSTLVQNSGTCQTVSKNAASYRRVDEVLNHANQQIMRSQSCFEVQRQLFNFGENVESIHVPRSQSSVELPTLVEPNPREATDNDSVGAGGKNKKISHLRILLEKSICSGNRIPYSGIKESSNVLPNGGSVISANQMTSSTQGMPNDQNCLLSQAKLISNERDLLKLNGLKILNSGPSYVPQSPSNRPKYFSFTPISPGPQSPLKTPSTPSASPFVSPRDTPVPRSRQNSSNDFLSPFEKKPPTFRSDSGKIEFVGENDVGFSKTLTGNLRVERNKPPTYADGCRPRSFSSTNFCRSKTRRNSSKAITFDHRVNVAPNRVQTVNQNNFLINSQFSIHKNFVSSECLSNEVRKFFKNNSVVTEDQSSATIRSQSVPLNRMMSESTWTPSQIYSIYFNSGSSNPAVTCVSGKFSEWTSNSETNSPKDLPSTVSPFMANREVPGVPSGSLNSDVYPADPGMTQLDDHYFGGEFRSVNEEGFSENDPFQENSAFTSKLDLNTTGTFDSPFTSESDPAIADNLKSYLPDFEGLDSKGLDNSEALNDRKLLKTSLYERVSDNLKDPVITSFKPVITNEMSSCPGSPVLNFFGTKMNEDNQQLIEFFDFED